MSLFTQLRSVGRAFFHRADLNHEMEDELRAHMEHRADDLVRSGMPPAEAMRHAAVEFGGRVHYQQESRDAMGGRWLETSAQDIRFGLRILLKSPGFTIAAVVTLALAIGANAVVFSLVNGLILRPVDLPDARNLVMIQRGSDPQQSYPDYLDMRDRNRTFDGMVLTGIAPVGLDANGSATTAWVYEASGNYFDVLGAQPYLGRFFHSTDEHGPNSSPYVVLNYRYWRSRFNGDPGVVGRNVQVNKHPYTVLGVAQPDFRGTELCYLPDFWVPVVNQEQIEGYSQLKSRNARGMWITGRLRSGVSREQARSDLNNIGVVLGKMYPKEDEGSTFSLAATGLMGDTLGKPVRAFLTGLMLLATLILVAACANLGSLFTARAADRSREIALRLALGSSRTRIVRQLLTEAMLISVFGGTVGMLGSAVLLRWMSVWQPVSSFPISLPVSPDGKVYLVALLLALVSGLIFGMVPVRQVLRANPYQAVKTGATSMVSRRVTLRDLMLVVQVIACAVLVTSSLVAVRGMMRALHSNIGFNPQGTILTNTDLDMADYSGDRVAPMQKKLLDTIQAMPGIDSVGISDRVPLDLGWATATIFKDDTRELKPSNAAADAMQYNISPGYLSAAATTLLAGRDLTWQDDAGKPRVALVNREFARRIFGTPERAIASHFRFIGGERIQVVGVVEDGKYKTLSEDQQPAVFTSILQYPTSATWLIVRSRRNPAQISGALAATVRALDPSLPFTTRTWDKELDSALFAPRAATISLGILGVMGAMLAITGIFGMASYAVSRRMRELGIRIALGAQRREVLWAALGRTLKLLAVGSVAGLALGFASSRALSSIVYQATAQDPLVLSGVVLAMLMLGLVATWIPASRAVRIDPLMLLREE